MRQLPDAAVENKSCIQPATEVEAMDWDDVRMPTAKTVTIGEPLSTLSISELESRVSALEAEIGRVKTEIDAKRRQADAANSLFKS